MSGFCAPACLVFAISVAFTYLHRQRVVHLCRRHPRDLRLRRGLRRQAGFTVVGLGTYSRELAREVRAAASGTWASEALITDDYWPWEKAMAECRPQSWCSGTRMERPCQTSPPNQLGIPRRDQFAPTNAGPLCPPEAGKGAECDLRFLGASLMMGLEEHLIGQCSGMTSIREGTAGHLAVGHPAVQPARLSGPGRGCLRHRHRLAPLAATVRLCLVNPLERRWRAGSLFRARAR